MKGKIEMRALKTGLGLLFFSALACGTNPGDSENDFVSGSGGDGASVGGSPTGGSFTSGGSVGSGSGASSGGVLTGGGAATGGSVATGGAATGGVATGGDSATGGVSTGGVATGGASTGGDSATGGVATGGNSSGGASTGGVSSGGSSTGGVSSGGSSSGGSSGCDYPAWASGTNYVVGDVVTFEGSLYITVNDNPGYDPTISTWFWDPYEGGCGTGGSSSGGSSSGGSSSGGSASGGAASGGSSGTPTADQLLAKVTSCASSATAIKGGFGLDGAGSISMYSCGSAVYWKADMDVDCDGIQTPPCDTDSTGQPQTSIVDLAPSGDVDPTKLPYFVIPLGNSNSTWYTAYGIQLGQVGAVIYGGKVFYGIFADEAGGSFIGEASYAMCQLFLGAPSSGNDPCDPNSGGIDPAQITYVTFTGAGNRATGANIYSHTTHTTMGTNAANAWLGE